MVKRTGQSTFPASAKDQLNFDADPDPDPGR